MRGITTPLIPKLITKWQIKLPILLNPEASGCGAMSMQNGMLIGIYTSFNAVSFSGVQGEKSLKAARREDKEAYKEDVSPDEAVWEALSLSSEGAEHSGYCSIPQNSATIMDSLNEVAREVATYQE